MEGWYENANTNSDVAVLGWFCSLELLEEQVGRLRPTSIGLLRVLNSSSGEYGMPVS